MRRPFFSFAIVGISLCALAQTRSSAKTEATAIQHLKNLSASSFDSRLPRVSLEYFLAYETNDAPAKWALTECEKQSTDGNVAQRHNSPHCIQADFDLNDGGALTIVIRVEESQNEQFSNGFLVGLTVLDVTGKVRQIRSLGDLPMELHRLPSRTPKDLPLPSTDSESHSRGQSSFPTAGGSPKTRLLQSHSVVTPVLANAIAEPLDKVA